MLAALALVPMSACVEPPEEVPPEIASAAESPNLVAFVRTNTGGTLEFYEPSPGSLFISGSEVAGVDNETHRLRFASLSADEIYARVTPDKVAPAELIEAFARAETRGTRGSSTDDDVT